MTFLAKLNFEVGDKRALMINADRATVFIWRGGELASSFVFAADDAGLQHFGRYLREAPNTPLHVLVDVVEEEYRQDTIPHVFGADRRAVLERKQARLFRGTNYCHAIMQGRETDGRRDDQVVLTALIKPEVITPWLDQIALHRIALAGIYSLPLVSAGLLSAVGASGTNVLLITLHGASGLRQTFFRDRKFKVSRLAPMPRLGTVPFGAYLMGELDKLRRYLSSLGLVSPAAPLDIYIFSHGQYLNEIETRCRDSEEERYFLVDVADIGRKLGISGALTTPYSDLLFAHVLLTKPPRNHYAHRAQTRYFALHQARVGLVAASFVMLLGGIGISGLAFIDGIAYRQQALDAQQRANFYQARYESARRELPPTPVEPQAIKTAVDIVSVLRRHKASPVDMMLTLSQALAGSEPVSIDQIDWIASIDPNRAPVPRTDAMATPLPATVPTTVAFGYYQIADVTGSVASFKGDYRRALAEVQRFADRLRQAERVLAVTVMRWPVDTSSAAALTGNTVASAREELAHFTLRVVLGETGGTG